MSLRPAPVSRDWWWIFDPRLSLRAAAALLVGVGMVLFTVLIAWLASRSLHRSLEAQLGQRFETLAVQVSDRLDHTLYERYRALLFAASLDTLRSYATSPAERRRVFAALQETAPDLVWISFIDAQGRIVASTQSRVEGTSAADRPWFRGAREHPYAGGPRESRDLPAEILAPESGETLPRVFDLAVPVTDPEGRFAGVLAAHLRWGWTREVLTAVIPEPIRRDQIGVTVYSADGDALLDSGGSGWTHPPDTPALPDPRRFRGSVIEPTALGTTYLTGFVRSRGLREYRGLGWITAVRQPVMRAFTPVAALRDTIMRWGLGFTTVGMIVAWLAAARHSRRLRSVGTAAARIEQGDILARLPSGRGDGELARMCGALDRMVDNLREKKPDA